MTFNVESVREACAPRARKLTKLAKRVRDWRGPLLRKQFQNLNTHTIGIQEARNNERATTSNRYFIVSSEHGNDNAGGPKYFKPEDIHVLVSLPRILVANIIADAARLTMRVATMVPQWNMDYDEHIYYYTMTVSEAAQAALPKASAKRYEEYISGETLRAILDRRRLARMIRMTNASSRYHPAVTKRIRMEAAATIGDPSRSISKGHIPSACTIATQLLMTADEVINAANVDNFIQTTRKWLEVAKKLTNFMANRDYDQFLDKRAEAAASSGATRDHYNEWNYAKKLQIFCGRRRREEATKHFGLNEAAQLGNRDDVINACNNAKDLAKNTMHRHMDNFASIYELGHDLVVIMIDLKAAFHKVSNGLKYKLAQCQDEIDDVMDNVDIPAALHPAIREIMRNGNIIERHVNNDHITTMPAEAHRDTWLDINTEASFARPRLGSGPGVPTADFTFNVLMSEVTKDYHHAACLGEVYVDIPSSDRIMQQDGEPKVVTSTSCVDDVKGAATAEDGDNLDSIIATMWSHLARATLSRGLPINAKRSSYMVYANSMKGKRRARPCTASDVNFDSHGMELTITRYTKLLGAMLNDRNDMTQEVTIRIPSTREATGPMRRSLFQRKAITNTANIHYLEVFALSKMLYHSGAWTLTKIGGYSKLESACSTAARQALGISHHDIKTKAITNADIIDMAGIPTLQMRLRTHRLQQLGRLIDGCPRELQALIDDGFHNDGNWAQHLTLDIQGNSQFLENDHKTKNIQDARSWIRAAYNDPRGMTCTTRLESKRDSAWRADEHRKTKWKAQISETCDGSIIPAPVIPHPDNHKDSQFMCYTCGAILASRTVHAKHVNRHHKPEADINQLAVGSTCQICLREYHTTNRLIKHLKASRRCGASWVNARTNLTDNEINASKNEIKRIRRLNKHNGLPEDYAELPVQQLQ
ncbi:unnamed protein product, partial [Prorocentrum cordatum]